MEAELEAQTTPGDFEFARPDLEAYLAKRKEQTIVSVYGSMACYTSKLLLAVKGNP